MKRISSIIVSTLFIIASTIICLHIWHAPNYKVSKEEGTQGIFIHARPGDTIIIHPNTVTSFSDSVKSFRFPFDTCCCDCFPGDTTYRAYDDWDSINPQSLTKGNYRTPRSSRGVSSGLVAQNDRVFRITQADDPLDTAGAIYYPYSYPIAVSSDWIRIDTGRSFLLLPFDTVAYDTTRVLMLVSDTTGITASINLGTDIRIPSNNTFYLRGYRVDYHVGQYISDGDAVSGTIMNRIFFDAGQFFGYLDENFRPLPSTWIVWQAITTDRDRIIL